MKRWIKNAVIPMIILVVILGTGFALSVTPKIPHSFSQLEELLPVGCNAYLVIDFKRLNRFLQNASFYKKMRELGIDKEIEDLDVVKKVKKKVFGNWKAIIGEKMAIGFYDKGYIIITKPSWWLRPFWRFFKAKNKKWYSGYFIYASSFDLMKEFENVNIKRKNGFEKKGYIEKEWIVRGKVKRGNYMLDFSELHFCFTQRPEIFIRIIEPQGIFGNVLRGNLWHQNPYIPETALFYVSFKDVKMKDLWNNLKRYAEDKEVLKDRGVENLFDRFFTKLDDRLFIVFTGFDEKKIYHAPKILVGLRIKKDFNGNLWEKIAEWMFKGEMKKKENDGEIIWIFETKKYVPPVFSFIKDDYLFITTDSAYVGQCKEKKDYGFYLDCEGFKNELIKYTRYLGKKSRSFSEQDVEEKVIPVLKSFKVKRIRLCKKDYGKETTLRFIFDF